MTGTEAASDDKKVETILIGGRAIGVYAPEQGQLEAIIRIQRTLSRGPEDDTQSFYTKQIDRLGILLESLIVEGDRDAVDMLFLQGKVDTAELMGSILRAHRRQDSPDKDGQERPTTKASRTRVRRA